MKEIKKIAQQMVLLQSDLNELLVDKDWIIKELDWSTAIKIETAELIDSTDWKWWKKQKLDRENIKVELIDILHFAISYSVIKCGITKTIKHLTEAIEEAKQYNTDKLTDDYLNSKSFRNTIDHINKQLIVIDEIPDLIQINNSFRIIFDILIVILSEFQEIDQVLKDYIIKNTLNIFRFTNGYKEGNYQKIWNYNGNNVEDNEVAYSLANDIEFNESFSKTLLKDLQNYYSK